VEISWQSGTGRKAALEAITRELRDAPIALRNIAALSLEQACAQKTQPSMQLISEKLQNAAIYGASPQDYMDTVAAGRVVAGREVAGRVAAGMPSSFLAEPEYIVSAFNCWLDGALIVKAGVKKGEETRWRIDDETLVREPSAYAQFATRTEQTALVTEKFERVMSLRGELVEALRCIVESVRIGIWLSNLSLRVEMVDSELDWMRLRQSIDEPPHVSAATAFPRWESYRTDVDDGVYSDV